MDQIEAIRQRHSVRAYQDKAIEAEKLEILRKKVAELNEASGLHLQLVSDEPKAFDGFMAHYGKFSGVQNYLALVGKKDEGLQEKCGYYGEQFVLTCQQLGLNTCWVALTYSKVKSAYQVDADEKLVIVIPFGYGATQGVAHKSKKKEDVMETDEEAAWFTQGVEMALLAPTAMNQQKFKFIKHGDCVDAKAGTGFYTKIDLGIVKYHFELGAGKDNFSWQ